MDVWLRLKNASYYNQFNGSTLEVKPERRPNTTGWRVCLYHFSFATGGVDVETGYADQEEAQAALDELMANAMRIQPPVQPEELNEEEDA